MHSVDAESMHLAAHENAVWIAPEQRPTLPMQCRLPRIGRPAIWTTWNGLYRRLASQCLWNRRRFRGIGAPTALGLSGGHHFPIR